MIEFKCPTCGETLEADDGTTGKKTQCLRCKTEIVIPLPDLLPRIQCPHCKAELDFPASRAGNVEPCRKCGGLVHLPGTPQGGGCTGALSFVAVLFALVWWTAGLMR